jgi:hypothetical protein
MSCKKKISVTISQESIDIVKKFYPGEKMFSYGIDEIIKQYDRDYTHVSFKIGITHK